MVDEADEQVDEPLETAVEPPLETAAIPENWRELPWPELRSLASKLSDTPISNKADAIAAIEARVS